jgi:hypothetical protein
MNLFLKEIKDFSKNNWWIYIIFSICLFFIYKTNSWNIIEISLVFLFHFLWDVFMMMMWDYYSKKEINKWSLNQIWWFLTFFSIWLYSWLRNWKWNYLLPQALFIWPSLKWYFNDIKKKNIKFLNYKIVIIFWFIVLYVYYKYKLIENIWYLIQIIGFIIFSLSLVLYNERKKYFWSLIWIWLTTLGTSIILYYSFMQKEVVWTDISYTLLPFTVFVFYIKNIKKYL